MENEQHRRERRETEREEREGDKREREATGRGAQGGGKLIRSEAARPVDFSGGEVAGVREFIFAVSAAEEREE